MSLLKRKSSRPQRKRELQRTSGASRKSLDCSVPKTVKQLEVEGIIEIYKTHFATDVVGAMSWKDYFVRTVNIQV
jgi:hypothetical protein